MHYSVHRRLAGKLYLINDTVVNFYSTPAQEKSTYIGVQQVNYVFHFTYRIWVKAQFKLLIADNSAYYWGKRRYESSKNSEGS